MIYVRERHLFCIEHGSGVLGDCRYNTHNSLLSCHLTYMGMASCPQGQTLNIPLEVRLYILVMISISGVLLHLDLIEMRDYHGHMIKLSTSAIVTGITCILRIFFI